MSSTLLLRSVLHEGQEAAYEAAHARIPDDLVEAHRRAGIHDWTIWRNGRELFHLVECDDLASAFRALEHDPANERWQKIIGGYVESFDATPMTPVWRMSAQGGG